MDQPQIECWKKHDDDWKAQTILYHRLSMRLFRYEKTNRCPIKSTSSERTSVHFHCSFEPPGQNWSHQESKQNGMRKSTMGKQESAWFIQPEVITSISGRLLASAPQSIAFSKFPACQCFSGTGTQNSMSQWIHNNQANRSIRVLEIIRKVQVRN